jgi:hypothetical protein
MSDTPSFSTQHAENFMATVRHEDVPRFYAIKVTDNYGTTIWLTPYPGQARWQVYIRNRERYDSDTFRDETARSVRNLLIGAIDDKQRGMGTSINYTNPQEAPV